MFSPIASFLCIQLFFVGGAESFVVNPILASAATSEMLLSAYTASSGGSGAWGPRNSGSGVPSKTACESAMNVEWEPMSELDRRIEDGIHYEHIPNFYNAWNEGGENKDRMPGCHSKAKRIMDSDDDTELPGVRAVFCGYRYSEDEYNRLKSADVLS